MPSVRPTVRCIGGGAAVMAVAVALGGCGQESGTGGLPELTAAAPTAGAGTGTEAPTATGPATSGSAPGTAASRAKPQAGDAVRERDLPKLEFGMRVGVLPGKVAADSPEEQDVVDAWIAWFRAASDSFYRVEVDEEYLADVAAPALVESVREHVAFLKEKNARTMGFVVVNPTKVKITNGLASVWGCAENHSVDVNATTGEPIEAPPLSYELSGSLENIAGTWIVTDSRSVSSGCTPPKRRVR